MKRNSLVIVDARFKDFFIKIYIGLHSSCCRGQRFRIEDGTGAFRRFCGEKPAAVKTNDDMLILGFSGPLNDYTNS